MANRNETATSTVILDGKQAEDELKKLKERSKELRQELVMLGQANDKAGFDKKEKELKLVNTQMRQLKGEVLSVENVLKNLNGTNFNDLQKVQRQISSEMKKMERGTEEYIDRSKQLQQVEKELKNVRNEMQGVVVQQKSWMSGLAQKFNDYQGLIMGVGAVLAGLVLGMKKASDSFNEFESRVANLSALTGLTGDDLGYLSAKAKELSISTTESGVNITQSAVDIVDAFTKMGSAQPQLLKDKDALAAVTEEALILAEAGKMEAVPAIEAVASAMNQFGLDSDEASRIINVFAAGSLAGSAEVNDLTASMKNVGAVANDSNLSLEQTVAVLEVMGEKQLKGEEAGTKLRGALLKLKAAGMGYQSGQFSLRDALVEVNAKLAEHGTALEQDAIKKKIFGLENVTAGTILLGNIEKFDGLTKAVTGTSVAYEQASINTATNSAKLEQAKNRAALTAIELGERLAPAMTYVTMSFSKIVPYLTKFIDLIANNIGVIKVLVVTIGTYVVASMLAAKWENIKTLATSEGIIATKAKIIWERISAASTELVAAATMLLSGNLRGAVQAMRVFFAAMNLNPFVAIATLVVGVGIAIYQYSQRLTDAVKAAQALNEVFAEVGKRMIDEKASLDGLVLIAKDVTKSYMERQKALKAINDLSPTYLGNLSLEELGTNKGRIAIDNYLKSLERKIKMEVLSEKIREESKKQVDIQFSKDEDNITYWEKFTNTFGIGLVHQEALQKRFNEVILANKKAAIDESIKMQKVYEKELEVINKSIADSSIENPVEPVVLKSEEIAANESAAKELKNKKEAIRAYELLGKKIEEYTKLLQDQVATNDLAAEQTSVKLVNAITEKKVVDDQIQALKDKLFWEKELANLPPLTKMKSKEVTFIESKPKEEKLVGVDYVENKKKQDALEFEAHQKNQLAIKKFSVDTAQTISDTIFTIHNNRRAADFENEMSILERQKQKELSQKNLTESQKNAINNKYAAKEAALKKKQWKSQQEAAALQTLINGALAITNILATMPKADYGVASALAIAAAAVTTAAQEAVILSTPMPQFSEGKYPAIGKDDGKTYKSNLINNAKTGMVENPAILVGEKPELIIDNPTLQRLMINFPEAIQAIYAARENGIPQYAKGKFKEFSGGEKRMAILAPGYNDLKNQASDQKLLLSIDNRLAEISVSLSSPVRAKVVMSDLEKVERDKLAIQNDYAG
ncbi:MAG: phage tail tape measure protein [Bacteroidota bacterium]